ncbi:MAG: flagellar biosynthetic protein FliQ [Myxococcota bacterium]|nr:flagellar biosynthetic protein FliQ [Myxococcota bacterium]
MDVSTFAILRETLELLLAIALPMLLVGLGVGLLVSILQAATQVQEQSLVFVPKLLAILATFYYMAPWSGQKLIGFVRVVFAEMARVGTEGSVF